METLRRIIQSQDQIPLAAVKPIDQGFLKYRAQCLKASQAALRHPAHRRASPVSGAPLSPAGDVEGIPYGCCPDTGGFFMLELPAPERWREVLVETSGLRRSPETLHAELAQSRTDTVYAPKLEWIGETLRLHGMRQPLMLEAVTEPSSFRTLLKESALCSDVIPVDETKLIAQRVPGGPFQAAVLLESLDRVSDPAGLVRGVAAHLEEGGLLFVTALVSSGLDFSILGLNSLYLFPPDRTNCFSLQGLRRLLQRSGFDLVEESTPGALDVQIVREHLQRDPALPRSVFERQLLEMNDEGQAALQAFLQQWGLSSFARIVAKRRKVIA
ncbi:MAG: hypothetical protein COV75_02165 [Candidatus Omnitrophica bacterium CG11_big_fil_rev_8_21_14_0_20_63_9]|nr:MAG: hypothetical protein COV75_02165 [Candidatus Omnitrophica bacterium CG11_big_fil_rev_8_21_14_0_20_63_9]